MSVEELYRMNKVRFDQLTFKEKYYKYLETDEWKEISKRLRRFKNKCSSCGYTYDLVVHHLNYDNVDLFNVGNEFFSDVAILCRGCHTKAHDGYIVFVTIECEEDYNSFREILSKSKLSSDYPDCLQYVLKSKTRLRNLKSEIQKNNSKKTIKAQKKPRVYIVYRTNYKYDYKDNRCDFPLKRIFTSKADAEQYIEDYPHIPWPYLKIKEMVVH